MSPQQIIIPGFQFSGIHCGIKDNSRKKDLALIYSEEPKTLIDGVFTQNRVCAAPVVLCRDNLKKSSYGQLILINSGVANACTGKEGLRDARSMQSEAARLFNLAPEAVYVSSTGKIGNTLPMKKIIPGIAKAKKELWDKGFRDSVKAIMTTDQYPKFEVIRGRVGSKKYTLAVMAKGAGMLRPNMATMLAYVMTDLKFSKEALHTLFRDAVNVTLNRVTVDGDTSTNDTVLMMANGRADNAEFSATSPFGKKIKKELTQLLEKMARQITLDGEGATKCCEVKITGAHSEEEAKKMAYAVGNSPLVKTALFGCDPNWGRIMAALGYSGAAIDPEKISIAIGPYTVVKNGIGVKSMNPKQVSTYLKKKNVEFLVNCHQGKSSFHVYMSDLTYDYVHLNAEYHT